MSSSSIYQGNLIGLILCGYCAGEYMVAMAIPFAEDSISQYPYQSLTSFFPHPLLWSLEGVIKMLHLVGSMQFSLSAFGTVESLPHLPFTVEIYFSDRGLEQHLCWG